MRFQNALGAVLLCSLAVGSGLAQAPSEDLQQLKQELQQLENSVENLKKKISVVEQAQEMPLSRPATDKAPPPLLSLTYIGEETRERQVANDNAIDAPRLDGEELDPTLRGYFRLPGTDTLIRLRGFAKTDLFYDLNVAGLWYGGLVPSSFPSSPQPKSPNSSVSIRPSRFTAEFRQPLGDDTVKGLVEWDLWGEQGRNTPNLRHFYVEYKNFLAGQTWSAFGDPDAFPDTLDFQGPPGMMGLRTPQFRYTQPLNPHNWLGLTIEKSGTDAPFSTLYGTPVGTQKWPDFVAFYRLEKNAGHIHAATIFRSVGGVVPNTTIPNVRAHKNGYGASLSGVWRMGHLRDNVVFQGIGGRGIANYYNDNYGLGSDLGFDANGNLVATPTWSASGGYQHYWTRKLRSTASYGYLRINNTAQDPGTNYHISQYATGNLVMQPSALYLFGAEFGYASLRRKDDFVWTAPRIQLSLTFFLNRYPVE